MAYDSTKYAGKDATIIYTGADGNQYTLNMSGDDNMRSDNWFRRGNSKNVDAIVQYYLEYGVVPTKGQLNQYSKLGIGDKAYEHAVRDLNVFISNNNIDLNSYKNAVTGESSDELSAQESAYNDYYNDLYSLKQGTLGRTMLDNYTAAEQNAAISNMQLAEAQYQQAAMQQAETVKAITDSVKAERMARLRAGMSESQIANQDMQIMLNNMNTLNQQVDTMNQNRLDAQQQYNLAQDTAYQQYVQSITGLGGTSAAMAASDAGDAYMQTLKRMKATGEKYNAANKHVTGQTT